MVKTIKVIITTGVFLFLLGLIMLLSMYLDLDGLYRQFFLYACVIMIVFLFPFIDKLHQYISITKLPTKNISYLREGPIEINAQIVSSPVLDSNQNEVGFCKQELQQYVQQRRSSGYKTQKIIRNPSYITVSDGSGELRVDLSDCDTLDFPSVQVTRDNFSDSVWSLFEKNGMKKEQKILMFNSKPSYRFIEQTIPLNKTLYICGTVKKDTVGYILKDGLTSLVISSMSEGELLHSIRIKLFTFGGIILALFFFVLYIILKTLLY